MSILRVDFPVIVSCCLLLDKLGWNDVRQVQVVRVGKPLLDVGGVGCHLFIFN